MQLFQIIKISHVEIEPFSELVSDFRSKSRPNLEAPSSLSGEWKQAERGQCYSSLFGGQRPGVVSQTLKGHIRAVSILDRVWTPGCCYSEYGPVSITRELTRNAEFWIPPLMYWARDAFYQNLQVGYMYCSGSLERNREKNHCHSNWLLWMTEADQRWSIVLYPERIFLFFQPHLKCPLYFSFSRISSDSFLCDCQLKWLPPWLLGRMLQAFVTATCAHPESLKGQSIFSVPSESFVCGKIIFLIFFFPHEKQGGALHYGSDSYDQS